MKKLRGHHKAVMSAFGWILSICWHPDGTKLASGSGDGFIKIWDAIQGTTLKKLIGHCDIIRSVNWHSDERKLAPGSDDIFAELWVVANGLALKTLVGHTDEVNCVSWHPTDTRLASGSTDNSIKI